MDQAALEALRERTRRIDKRLKRFAEIGMALMHETEARRKYLEETFAATSSGRHKHIPPN